MSRRIAAITFKKQDLRSTSEQIDALGWEEISEEFDSFGWLLPGATTYPASLSEEKQIISDAKKILREDAEVMSALMEQPEDAPPVIWKGETSVTEPGLSVEGNHFIAKGLVTGEIQGPNDFKAPYWRVRRLTNMDILQTD